MKTQKDTSNSSSKSNQGKAASKDKTNKKTAPVRDHKGATEKARANSGRGLNDEGTNVSYEDERRNGQYGKAGIMIRTWHKRPFTAMHTFKLGMHFFVARETIP